MGVGQTTLAQETYNGDVSPIFAQDHWIHADDLHDGLPITKNLSNSLTNIIPDTIDSRVNMYYIMEGEEGVPDWVTKEIIVNADRVSTSIVQRECGCTWSTIMAAASAPTTATTATTAPATIGLGAE
jgi:hypothetical protein